MVVAEDALAALAVSFAFAMLIGFWMRAGSHYRHPPSRRPNHKPRY